MAKPATDRLKFNPPLGTMPAPQFLLTEQLRIDPLYQRSLEVEASQTLIRSIAQHWNWDLCPPLVVSQRPDGALYVIDGQHRLAAARLRRDILQLPAMVKRYDSVEDEAATFVLLNQQRRPLSKLDLFKAAVASGDTTAVAIVEAMTDAGLTIASHTNYTAWRPGMVSNIGGIEACWRGRGAQVTRMALRALAQGFAGHVLQYAGTVFPGIAALIEMEARDGVPDGPVEAIDDDVWAVIIVLLQTRTQDEWRRAIMHERAIDPNLKFAKASERVMLTAWGAQVGEVSVATDRLASIGDDPGADDDETEDGDPEDGEPVAAAVAPAPPVPAPAFKPKAVPSIDWNRVTSAVPKPRVSAGKAGRAFVPDASGKAWCCQCDRRKTRGEVQACKDPFCRFGASA